MTKIYWTVEQADKESYYSNYHSTLEFAQTEARRKAYTEGKDYFIMAPIATAKAPAKINDVVIEAV